MAKSKVTNDRPKNSPGVVSAKRALASGGFGVDSGDASGDERMRFRFGIDRWKAVQALVWAIFSIAWAGVGTSVALHFQLEDSWLGIAIFAGPLIALFSFFVTCLIQAFKIEHTSVLGDETAWANSSASTLTRGAHDVAANIVIGRTAIVRKKSGSDLHGPQVFNVRHPQANECPQKSLCFEVALKRLSNGRNT
jgi:hypothetical protein